MPILIIIVSCQLMVRIIENYTLYEIIGQGAYGKVYRAINKNDSKEYAVKVIEVRRFKENRKLEECTVNEINILTNIDNHQHIIKYFDMLKTPNNFYFIYEFCNGGTLEGVLRKERTLSEKKALLVFKQLIDAFQVLNKYNIMHRDLKPDNIFFTNGIVKLGDFGFCKSLEKANMTKTMLGSPIYMAPEILRGEVYSTKADIWSLGVVLYEMLYGFCPFESTTIPKLLEVLKETELQFPTKEQVTDETKRLLKRLLTKDSTKRIEWMQLLKVNITNEGKLVGNRQQLLSLVEQNNSNILDSAKLTDSNKLSKEYEVPSPTVLPQKKQETVSNQSFSPSTTSTYTSEQNLGNSGQNQPASFMKKKANNNNYEVNVTTPINSGKQINQNDSQSEANSNIRRNIFKEHAEISRGFQIATDLIKSNDTNGLLFAFLLLKKAELRLVAIRDEVANFAQGKQLMICFNSQLKEINIELGKYNLNENIQNWKSLLKSTGEFHRNFRAFYMMVAFLAGEIPRDDLSHVEMQMQVRNKLY